MARAAHGLLALLAAPLLAGAWEIGHTRPVWTDPERGDRAVTVDIWYPALAAGEEVPAAPAPPEGFPALVFGHGFLISADRYTWLRDGLVPAGRWLALPRTETGFSPNHLEFARDLAFIARRLAEESADPASPWQGRLGPLAAGGHSMGGGAAVLAASLEPAFSGLAALAPAETTPSAVAAAAQVAAPALLVTGSLDCVTPTAQHGGPIHAALGSGCRDLVELTGASHCQFAASDFFCNLGETFCSSPTLSRTAQQAATLALLAPWLDALDGDAGAWAAYLAARDAAPATVLSECPEPPVLAMGTLEIRVVDGAPTLAWPPVPSALSYSVEGAPLDALADFQPVAQTADTSWTADPAQPWRWFRVRATR